MEYGKYHYAFLDEHLIIMTKIRDNIQFRPPSGKYSREIIDKVFQLAKKEGSEYPVVLIDEKTKELLSKDYPNLEFNLDRAFFDYVYLSSNLAELAGSDYSKIRNRLNKFKKSYQYTLENITEDNMKEVGEFLKRWCLWKDCESDPLLENERKAILYSMSNFLELKLSGIAMRINNEIESIAVFEKMNPDTVVVHYEKGSPDFDGIYKAINQESAKIIQKDFTYINRESDMNLPGLRKAKMSYRPHHMIEISHINSKSISF
jgi:hypothetical protein